MEWNEINHKMQRLLIGAVRVCLSTLREGSLVKELFLLNKPHYIQLKPCYKWVGVLVSDNNQNNYI